MTALCTDLGIESDEPFLLYEDNQAAMKMAKNSFDTRRTMHLDRRAHFIRAQVNDGQIQLSYCPTKEMQAGALTKILPRPAHEHLRSLMGLTNKHATTISPRILDSLRL